MTPDRAFAWIRQRVEWSDQGWLAYIFTDDRAAADALRTQLEPWFQAQGLAFEALRPGRPDELASLGPRLAQRSGSIWLEALFAGDRWETAWVDCLLRLNSQRDTMLSTHRMVLFVAPTSTKARVQAAGPDLWAKHERVIALGDRTRSLSGVVEPASLPLRFRDVEQVADAAIRAGLPALRPALMRGIPSALSQRLVVVASPADQLHWDVMQLNNIYFDGKPALSVWLRNAASLAQHEPEVAATLRSAAQQLQDAPLRISTAIYEAFLIFGRESHNAARSMARELEARGLRVYLDNHSFQSGEDWTTTSLAAQTRSTTNIWFVGDESRLRETNSLVHQAELAVAIVREHSIPGSLIAIHPDTSSMHSVDFILPKSALKLNVAEQGWEACIDAIESHINAR